MLPAAIQVCPIELPGRGRRRGEPPVNDVAVLADQLADALPLQVTSLDTQLLGIQILLMPTGHVATGNDPGVLDHKMKLPGDVLLSCLLLHGPFDSMLTESGMNARRSTRMYDGPSPA